jgi:DNA replication initiation complex subunit (GINS family)
VPPPEPLTYENLRKRQQLERTSPKLTRLEPAFYRDLELYLRALGEDHQREHAANPASPKATLLGDELQSTRRLAEDLYEHRERKVVSGALAAARGGTADIGPMLKEEQELYEALVQLLRDTKRRVLHRPGAPPPAPRAQPEAKPEAPAPAPEPPMGRLLVRVLEDVGSFAASDLRIYHLAKEQLVSLPEDAARVLILRGKAVEVAATP